MIFFLNGINVPEINFALNNNVGLKKHQKSIGHVLTALSLVTRFFGKYQKLGLSYDWLNFY